MKATEAKLLNFLKQATQFVIPIYQRTYSWTEKECRQLWDDIIRCGKNDSIPIHFIGSIVYVANGLSQVTQNAPLLVIDGQQRLTSVSLILTALAEVVAEEEPFEGFSQKKIRNYFLLNPEENEEKHYKLILSQTDKDTLKALVNHQPLPENVSLRVKENYDNFLKWLKNVDSNLAVICKGLAKLAIVDVALDRSQDNPQLIFESMNSTGKELSQADLIRNFILMSLEHNLQTRLYEQYWRPMEVEFGQEAYGTHFDGFMRYFLTVKTGVLPNINAVYESFKTFSHETRVHEASDEIHIEKIVEMIRRYSRYFCAMALNRETDPELKKAFSDLRELKVDVAYPFLLELYHDYAASHLSKNDFLTAVRWVESFVFRRVTCSIPTNSMNKTFATLSKSLKKDRYLESIAAALLLLPSYRRFPSDEEFARDIQTRDLYNFRSRSYWLRKLENFGRKEPVPVAEYTVEHILPQNENLNAEWQKTLGEDWKKIQHGLLHTLGNLTLTGYNSEYSDRSFIEKRDMEGGFRLSPLKVNEGLAHVEIWNEAAIRDRARRLAGQAVAVWPSPKLEQAVLDAYRPAKSDGSKYSLADHPFLDSTSIKPIFEALRREVLNLDPCVTEEFLKLYVAYKAETNFVDVIPQAKRLILSLNIGFSEIVDPKGICRNVAGIGRWGNGDVEVMLSSTDELPYIIGLVRQALEKQLGGESE